MSAASHVQAELAASQHSAAPFLGLIDSVIVAPGGAFTFDGAISRDHAQAIWTWMTRDVAPEVVGRLREGGDAKALDGVMHELLVRSRAILAQVGNDPVAARHVKMQLGSEDAYSRLPSVLTALKARALLEQARAFGRAINAMPEDKNLAAALQAIPVHDASAGALIMQAAVGQVEQPSRLVAAAIKLSGAATETALVRAGHGGLIEAMLAHAQDQVPLINLTGTYADIDLVCQSIERFHRLIRAVSAYVEMTRGSYWATVVSTLIAQVSDRVEARVRYVVPDITQALRKPREGNEHIDEDKMLHAISGLYLVITARNCRDSLALNTLLDQAWSQAEQVLETQIKRILEAIRIAPEPYALHQIDGATKMAELRFSTEYAQVLRQAKLNALAQVRRE